MTSERIRFRNVDRLVGRGDQQDDMIASVVAPYDAYLKGPFVRLTFLP